MKNGLHHLFGQGILCLLLSAAGQAQAHAEDMPTSCEQDCPAPFVNNEFWTTEYGPAAANILLSPTNFLACSSSAYALCYYSGPDAGPSGNATHDLPSLPCKLSKDDPKSADCRCYVESGASYVDIHAIRNTEAYTETIRVCGLNGEKCNNMASEAAAKLAIKLGKTQAPLATAPVCSYLQTGADGRVSMAPKTELVSTFSFAKAKRYGTEQTSCPAMPYAGCMTASCNFELDENGKRTGFANCHCPIYSGPYQVGQAGVSCDAGGGNVWSAAYAPPSETQKDDWTASYVDKRD